MRLTPAQLDQSTISKAEFRVERPQLQVTEKLAIRKLFQSLNVLCRSGEELAKTPLFLDQLASLGRSAGGNAPLPSAPSVALVEDVRARVGSDQLAGIRDNHEIFTSNVAEWTHTKQLIDTRLPAWSTVERYAKHAQGLANADELLTQLEVVRSQRLLLQPTDPVSPIRDGLASILRQALHEAVAAHTMAFNNGIAELERSPIWSRIALHDRSAILENVGLVPHVSLSVSTDELLLASLDSKTLSSFHSDIEAVPGRVQRAMAEAATLLNPTARPIAVERAALATEADVDAWLQRQRKTLVAAMKDGPVLVS